MDFEDQKFHVLFKLIYWGSGIPFLANWPFL